MKWIKENWKWIKENWKWILFSALIFISITLSLWYYCQLFPEECVTSNMTSNRFAIGV